MLRHALNHFKGNEFCLWVKRRLKHISQPKNYYKKWIFFVTLYISLSFTHVIFTQWLCIELEFLPYFWWKLLKPFFHIIRLKQIENCWFYWFMKSFNCIKFTQTRFKNRVYVVSDQRNSVITIKVWKVLKTWTNLEKHFAKTLRKDVFIPLSNAI
jgi:hypothetical protein